MLYLIPDIEQIEESLRLAEQYGAAFEYNDFFQPEVYENSEEINRRIAFYRGLDRDRSRDTLHGVFLDITPHSSDAEVRQAGRKKMRQSMETASLLGIRGVIFHTNLVPNFRNADYLRAWAERNEEWIRTLLSEYPDLEIYYENMFDLVPDDLKALAERLSDEPRFGVCLDYAHARVFGKGTDWSCLLPFVKHLHINDNDLMEDLHLAVGSGKLDWKQYDRFMRSQESAAPSVLIETASLKKWEQSAEFMKENGLYPFVAEDGTARKPEGGAESAATEKKADQDALTNGDLRKIIQAAIDLTNETDRNLLLSQLLQSAMDITHCDAGTIYQKNGETLEFRVMKTISQGVDRGSRGEPVNIPPVELKEESVCGYCAIHGELINIDDVYTSDRFDFTGPKKYDAITGYRTRSMIVIPIQNEKKELVGVMQLMNAKDAEGNDSVFSADDEFVLRALSSVTAMLILNMNYTEDIRRQMHSFVSAFATAVDKRTPYNGSHTRKVAAYARLLAEEINRRHEAGECEDFLDPVRMENLELAATLHDIGKMIIPLEIMNKESRLGDERLKFLEERFTLLHTLYDRDACKGRITGAENEQTQSCLDQALSTIHKVNTAGFLTEELQKELAEIASHSYEYEDGTTLPYLTEEELECLNIKKGTLTRAEREIMESHAMMTRVILGEVYFNEEYAPVPKFASAHHEMLDGSGYPDHLKGDELELETRILAVVDIYDAMTAEDRPYKKPIPREKAFAILKDMAAQGKLEGRLIEYLETAVS